MRLRIFWCLVLLLCAATPSLAQDLKGGCAVRFYGDSTLHAFEGKGACEPFSLTLPIPSSPEPEAEVRVAGLDTDNSSRNKSMRKMFSSGTYPLIVAHFAHLDPAALLQAWQSAGTGAFDFALTIRAQTRPVKAVVRNLTVTAQKVTFTLAFPVSLQNYGLEAPSLLGFIRVADEVKVEVDTSFEGDIATLFPAALH